MQDSDFQLRHYPYQKKSLIWRGGSLFTVLILTMIFVLLFASAPLYAQNAPDPFACYGIGDEWLSSDGSASGTLDSSGTEIDFDYLAIIDRTTGTATPIAATGTRGIEAMAFVPDSASGGQVLYAFANSANTDNRTSDTLGTVDLSTGAWTVLGPALSTATGPGGATYPVDGDANLGYWDIDGLTYDVSRDILWATNRTRTGGVADMLLQIDPATGQIVEDAFGPDLDYVEIPLATEAGWVDGAGAAYDDIDDFAVDPVTGRMFAIMNKGGTGGGLVELNPADGTVIAYIGLFSDAAGAVDDMEGLSFFNDGQLYGSTGNNGPDPLDSDKLFVINITDASLTEIGSFPAGIQDIEALGCLTAPAFITLEKATNGEDADQPTGPNIPAGGAVAWTYVIENTGAVPLINMTLSDDILGDISTSCAEGPLPNPFASGDTFTCTVSGTADVVGQYANVATVEAIYQAPDPDGLVDIPLSAEDPSHYFGEVSLVPGISIIKTAGDAADGEIYTAAGPGLVTFTYVVENSGNTHLTNITIEDDAGTPADTSDDVTTDSATCPDLAGPLAPGGIVTCTAEIQVDENATNIAVTEGTPTDENGTPIPDLDNPTADDPADVFIPMPGISIIKTAGDAADGEIYTAAGPGLVTFTYDVENSGNTYLTNITIQDDAGTPADTSDDVTTDSATCPDLAGPLAPGGIVTCTADIQVAENATNIAVVEGTPTDENGTPIPGVDNPTADDPADVIVPMPGISIIKTAGDAADGETYVIGAPGLVTFIYTVNNTGDTYLSDIRISDDAGTPSDTSDDVLLTGTECAELAGPLAPDGRVICTAEIRVNGDATNVAETIGNPTDENGNDLPGVQDPTDDDPADVAYVPGTPGVSIVKTAGDAADGEVYTAPGPGPVLFTYVVENTGGTYLIDLVITDDAGTASDASDDVTIAAAECAALAGPLAPGESVTCTAEIDVADDATNVATVTGTPSDADGNPLPGVEPPTASDPADVVVPEAGIEIIKTAGDAADGETYTIDSPQLVTFHYTVMNTGATYLSDISISDDAGTLDDTSDDLLLTGAECADLAGPLAPGDSVQCTADIMVNGDAINIAGTSGNPTDADGNDLPNIPDPTDDDPADVAYVPGAPGIQIIKTAGNAADGELLTIGAPQLVTFNYEVTNTGDTYLSDISISDDAGTPSDTSDDVLLTSAECADLAGPLAMGSSLFCTADIRVNAAATNVAETTGNPTDADGNDLPGVQDPSDDDPADVAYLPGVPAIQIIKTAGDAVNGATYQTDQPGLVLFTYFVKNIGGTYLTDITITDDAGTAADASDDVTVTSAECLGLAGPLAPGDGVLCSAEIQVNGDAVNNASTTGTPTDQDGNPLPGVDAPTAQDDAEVLILGAIGDTVWMDLNSDGIQDADEMGIPDVTVTLTLADGSSISAVTDADGMYLFPDLPSGDYSVMVDANTLPVGVTQTYDADGTETEHTSTLSLGPGEQNMAQDFGYVLLTPGIQLEKTVYAGHTGGADCPGGELETGADRPITYCFTVINTGDTYLIDITLTDDDLGITHADMTLLSGSEPLAPDAEMVFYYETILEEDLVNTAEVSGTPSDAEGNPIPGLQRPVDQDIAQVKAVASVGDYVWFDRDADGTQESAEVGIEGVTVHLLDADGDILESTTTDADGFYLFDNLAPADYAIQVETPVEGYLISPMDNFDDTFDSDIDPDSGRSEVFTLEQNQNIRTLDAGFTAPPQLQITKRAQEDTIQPSEVIVYELEYANIGVGDAEGVVITEVVPRNTYFLPQFSTPGWNCEAGSTQAGTICTFEIGFLAAGSDDNGILLFAVQSNTEIPSEISTIDNQVIIGDDGTNGPQVDGQTTATYTVAIQRPTSIEVDFEPGISSGGTDRIFLPFVGRRLRSDGSPYTLSMDQKIMSLFCGVMDNFGWSHEACFITLE